MRRRFGLWLAAGAAAATLLAGGTAAAARPAAALCSAGYVSAHLSWGARCLRAGEFCKVGNVEYRAYGFDCPASGHLAYSVRSAPAQLAVPALWRSCTAVHTRYPHGVGRVGAHDRTSGRPVTNFLRSTKLYDTAMHYNRRLDGDRDGIACERR
jgi:Excalibur calcium-binding domain